MASECTYNTATVAVNWKTWNSDLEATFPTDCGQGYLCTTECPDCGDHESSCEFACDTSNDVGAFTRFKHELKTFLRKPFDEKCTNKYETQINCDYPPFEGNLFINKNACNKLKDTFYYRAEDTISGCRCFCGSSYMYIYCRLILTEVEKNVSTTEQPWPPYSLPESSSASSTQTSTSSKQTSTSTSSTPIQTTTRITSAGTKTTKTSTLKSTYAFDTSSQDPIWSSDTTSFTKNHASKINDDSGKTIGAAVGGTVALLVVLVLPLMFLIWRRKFSRKAEGKPKDLPIRPDGFISNAYNELEENTGSMHAYMNGNSTTACQHYDMLENNDLHGKEYDYVGVQEISSSTSANQLPRELVMPRKVTQAGSNYFVLEQENHTNKAIDDCVADNVYNTLNEKHKTEASTDDEYYHLREISRPRGKGTGDATEGDASDYDVLAKASNFKDEYDDDDYDHCKPKL